LLPEAWLASPLFPPTLPPDEEKAKKSSMKLLDLLKILNFLLYIAPREKLGPPYLGSIFIFVLLIRFEVLLSFDIVEISFVSLVLNGRVLNPTELVRSEMLL
jgi:hypothetical protein